MTLHEKLIGLARELVIEGDRRKASRIRLMASDAKKLHLENRYLKGEINAASWKNVSKPGFPVEKSSKEQFLEMLGMIATIFIFLGAPLAALLPDSILGWILYAIGAVLMAWHGFRKRDRWVILQFLYFLFWNIMAIMWRLP